MTMITPSYLGETIEYSSLHACRSTLEDPTRCGRRGEGRGLNVCSLNVGSWSCVHVDGYDQSSTAAEYSCQLKYHSG